jgi:hypothetical protein
LFGVADRAFFAVQYRRFQRVALLGVHLRFLSVHDAAPRRCLRPQTADRTV